MDGKKAKLCPICKLIVLESQDSEVCKDCGAYHHRKCWGITKQCGNEMCPSKRRKPSMAQKEDTHGKKVFCGNCGKELQAHQEFCPVCGAKRSVGHTEEASKAAVPVEEKQPKKEKQVDLSGKAETKEQVANAECKTVQKRFCGFCGNELKEGQIFCGKCGHSTV